MIARAFLLCFGLLTLALAFEHFTHSRPQPTREGRPNYEFATLPYLRDSTAPPRLSGESDLAYATRLNEYVHRSTYHCPASAIPDLSLLERMIEPAGLFRNGLLVRERFDCGQCGQRVFLLRESLAEAGIQSKVLGLKGHVVLLMGDHVLDPDFGVGPFRYSDPNLYRAADEAYSRFPAIDADYAELLASKGDNFLYREHMQPADAQERLFALANLLAVALIGLALVALREAVRRSSIMRAPVLAPYEA
jgi:hypothetical protein